MRTFFLLALAVVFASAPVDSSRSSAFAAAPPPSGRFGSVEADGCKLEVELPNAPEAGSPVCVRAKIINTGKVPLLVVWQKQAALPFDVVLKADGKPVPLTRYGVKRIAPTERMDQLRLLHGSTRGSHLKPGESHEEEIPNLALYYDLTVPGEYDLTVSRYVTIGGWNSKKGVRLRVKGLRLTISNP